MALATTYQNSEQAVLGYTGETANAAVTLAASANALYVRLSATLWYAVALA